MVRAMTHCINCGREIRLGRVRCLPCEQYHANGCWLYSGSTNDIVYGMVGVGSEEDVP